MCRQHVCIEACSHSSSFTFRPKAVTGAVGHSLTKRPGVLQPVLSADLLFNICCQLHIVTRAVLAVWVLARLQHTYLEMNVVSPQLLA